MNLEEFIKTQIESVDELRALLLFQASPQASWSAPEVGGKLYLPPVAAVAVLGNLVAKGLLSFDEAAGRYSYKSQPPEMAGLIEELVKLDRERPVTLINMIYHRPKDLQAFADAFKLKKEKGN